MAADKTSKDEADELRCSFCDKSQREVRKLVAGPKVFICDECVDICVDIIDQDRLVRGREERPPLAVLRERLEALVVGQPEAKRTLSAALYLHALSAAGRPQPSWPRGHILLTGPTGVGKSFLVRTLAAELSLTFVQVDATRLTEVTYFEERDPFNLVLAETGVVEGPAKRGVVLIDQLDRVACDGAHPRAACRFQESLISLFDGAVTAFTRSHDLRRVVQRAVDTSGILFICSGIFREGDPLSAGLRPELVDRFATICPFEALTEDALAAILSLPESSLLDEYRQLFATDALELRFTDKAVRTIAAEAARRPGGARSLRSVLDGVAREALDRTATERPADGQLTVDEDLVARSLS